jgi:regulator of RNase E activity RraA
MLTSKRATIADSANVSDSTAVMMSEDERAVREAEEARQEAEEEARLMRQINRLRGPGWMVTAE